MKLIFIAIFSYVCRWKVLLVDEKFYSESLRKKCIDLNSYVYFLDNKTVDYDSIISFS